MRRSITYLILTICGISMVVPFIWMVTTAVKSQLEVNKGNVGFLPIEKYSAYNDGSDEYRIKIIKTEKDSSWVNLIDDEGKIFSAFRKIPNAAITKKTKIKFHFDNFVTAFNKVPFNRYFLNTLIVSFSVVFGVIVTGSLAAYAFAR
ncbi:MAG TPA: carbohydrate ABC transporter permease, partial [Candidatus Cloacimonetes bacterium]|nr:carbohydrate ABC transporter permease [Candidatus Cloacimonadota bacterium]